MRADAPGRSSRLGREDARRSLGSCPPRAPSYSSDEQTDTTHDTHGSSPSSSSTAKSPRCGPDLPAPTAASPRSSGTTRPGGQDHGGHLRWGRADLIMPPGPRPFRWACSSSASPRCGYRRRPRSLQPARPMPRRRQGRRSQRSQSSRCTPVPSQRHPQLAGGAVEGASAAWLPQRVEVEDMPADEALEGATHGTVTVVALPDYFRHEVGARPGEGEEDESLHVSASGGHETRRRCSRWAVRSPCTRGWRRGASSGGVSVASSDA